jgi:hypothetical protein
LQLFQNISYLDLGEGEVGEVLGGAGLLTGVGVARWKAWPAIEKNVLKFSIIVDLSVVTVLPCLSAVGSWEEVILFSMDFSLKYCISRGLFDANAVRHRIFLCCSRAVRSGENQGLYLFLVQFFLKLGMLI